MKSRSLPKLPGIHKVERGQTLRFTADVEKMHLFDAAGKNL